MRPQTATLTSWLLLCLAAITPALLAQQPLSTLPGYVDLDALELFSEDDLTIEINLGDSLLGILSSSLEDEDSEFADLLAKLRSVRVNVYSLADDDEEAARDKTRQLTKALMDQGWEAIVRVMEDDESIQILLRQDQGKIAGVVAMFVEEGDSAGFINIVGEVDPGQIARIGRQLNIRALEMMDDALADQPAHDPDQEDPR